MSSPMYKVSNDPKHVNYALFNSAYWKYVELANAHRIAYEISNCHATRNHHAAQHKDCMDKVRMLRNCMENMVPCKTKHHGHNIIKMPPHKKYPLRHTIPIERLCHS